MKFSKPTEEFWVRILPQTEVFDEVPLASKVDLPPLPECPICEAKKEAERKGDTKLAWLGNELVYIRKLP